MKSKLSTLGFVLILSALIISGCGTTTEIDVDVPDVEVAVPAVKVSVDIPNVEVDVPDVEVDVDVPDVKVHVEVPDVEVAVGELRTESRSVELDGAESVRVEIKMGAGELEVAGGVDELLNADFTYNVDKLNPEAKYSDGKLIVKHALTKAGIRTFFDLDDYRNEWDLRFNEDVPMDMRIDVGAGRSDLTLGSLALTSLDIKAGAGEVTVDLTGAPSLTQLDFDMGAGELLMDLTGDWTDDLNADITGVVGEMTLRLPGSVGVRVDVKGGLGTVSASNLAKDGDTYTNDAYGESEVTLRIDIKAGIGEINLNG